MGYVDSAPTAVSSSDVRRAYKASLDEGVCYGLGKAVGNDKAELIKNMWLKNGVLTSRDRLAALEFMLGDGKVHSVISAFGREFIHVSSSLYTADEDGFAELYSGVPDKDGLFVEFSGKLYLFCGTYVFSVDKELKVTEEFPYCPVYSRLCFPDNGSINRRDEEFVPNILAPACRIYYGGTLNSAENRFSFPKIMDKSRPYRIYVAEVLIDASLYTVDENSFYLPNDIYTGTVSDISIECYVNHSDFDVCGTVSGCTCAVTYGGNTHEGTRVFVAGNPEYTGRYFFSEPGEPLSFKEDMSGVVSSGNEDITAFSKQHSDLLLFTENTVSRMRYNYTSEGGGYFSVHVINSDIGCDMPESVEAVENRTVFACSKSGIYIVDSTDSFDLLNILPISANITDDSGENGFFSVSQSDRKKGTALCADGKYMLLCGDKVFIWDYGVSPYVSSSNYAKAQSGLAWFEFDGFEGVEAFFRKGGRFYALKRGSDGILSAYEMKSDGKKCVYAYRSGTSMLDSPFNYKYAIFFNAGFRLDKSISVKVRFYGDGCLYAEHSARLAPGKDGLARLSVKIPKYACRSFAFEIGVTDSGTGITDVGFDYIIKKKTENYMI